MIFKLNNMSCGYNNVPVLSDISFSVNTGEILCILGPNGVGKTTLFKSMLGLLHPLEGTLEIDGEDVSKWSNRVRATYIGYIPQSHVPPFPYSVTEVVVMGRVANLGVFGSPSESDYKIAEQAINSLGIQNLKDRVYTELSGGERQMVLIARALAQQPKVLLMDEPTANLDYGNQTRVLRQVQELADSGLIVVMTTHSPDHAFLCSSKVLLIARENNYIFGSAEEVVTVENLYKAYGITVNILTEEKNGKKIYGCVPEI